jgi:E-phenylitaconyl-CoA hydratase
MSVLYEKDGKIVTITLNRPEVLNRIDAETYCEFSDALMKFRDDSTAWVAIITGAGEAFSTGADHDKLLRPWADNSFQVPPTIMWGLDVWKPLIAAINGAARGGGFTIVLACDIRIAAETAYLQMPEVGRGLLPGWGGTQRLPRMLPRAKAAEMLFLGTSISAEEAYRLGLVNKVVPLAQLLPTAKEWAVKICDNAPLGVCRAKEAMIRGGNMTLEDGLRLELGFFEEMLHSEYYKEGLQAKNKGRKPRYKGR